MNNLYFACCDCKIYIDAGYRWAYWKLQESGIVSRRSSVNVKAVLNSTDYWNPPPDEESRWLRDDVLPNVWQFLLNHRCHHIAFGEEEEFAPIESDDYFAWMQIGYLAQPTPRFFVEVMGFTSWDQVGRYISGLAIPPAWWEVTWIDPSPHERAKHEFENLVRQNQTGS